MINFEEKITRKSNLQMNDSLSCYAQHCAQQSDRAYELFYKLLQEVQPERILEIGTGLGGFTLFLAEMCEELKLQTQIKTYDIREPAWSFDTLRQKGIDVNIQDMFSNTNTNHPVIQPVLDFIQNTGTTIILCDGGNKINEFKILSTYMKSGDFIMAHDYAKTREFFDKHINRKIWNWVEIKFDDIKESVLANNLIEYQDINFDEGVWCCFQKK